MEKINYYRISGYLHSYKKDGSDCYLPNTSFESIIKVYEFDTAKKNNKELPFIKHHNKLYDGKLPIWVAVEIMTMGNIHSLYDNLLTEHQKRIARKYNTGPNQLEDWIENLTYTRNHLAHYMRIFRYSFGRIPATCKNHPMNVVYRGKIFDHECCPYVNTMHTP